MKHFQKFVLFTLLIIAGSCNKEKTPTQSVDSSKEISEVSSNLFQTTGSFDFVTDAELKQAKESSGAGIIERGGESYYFTPIEEGTISTGAGGAGDPPTYPNYNGQCKFIFRLFDTQNCENCAFPYATIRFRTFFGGTILASYNVNLGSGWTELNVPQSCFVSIEMGCAGFTGDPHDRDACQYKIQIGEYGWNKRGTSASWIPSNVEVYMAFLRYPPQGAVNTNYLVYLCDSWCTWNAQFQIGQANPSPADYSFECAFQTFGVNGSWIKRYDHIMQNANSTLYKYVYPLQVNSVYQFNNTANSPTSTLNTQLSCTVSGGGIGVPISSVTFGWGTSDRVGCVDGCGIFYVE